MKVDEQVLPLVKAATVAPLVLMVIRRRQALDDSNASGAPLKRVELFRIAMVVDWVF